MKKPVLEEKIPVVEELEKRGNVVFQPVIKPYMREKVDVNSTKEQIRYFHSNMLPQKFVVVRAYVDRQLN